jgi:hypothetical protein
MSRHALTPKSNIETSDSFPAKTLRTTCVAVVSEYKNQPYALGRNIDMGKNQASMLRKPTGIFAFGEDAVPNEIHL